MKETYLLYGEEKLPIEVPDSVDILESGDSPEIPDIHNEIQRRICNPIGTFALEKLIRQKNPETVAITISDITRAVPNRIFLPHLLKAIENYGVKRENISIIVGTGMHRPSTEEEHIHLTGEDIFANYRVIDHNAAYKDHLTTVSENPPVSINSTFLKADFKIVTGFIEPHFMAGYSGGRKGVCPALVDLGTVQKFHGFETLSSPKAAAGILDGNPCHETALGIAKNIGVDFLFNVALNRDFQISGIFCGDLEKAHIKGCEYVSEHSGCTIDRSYDLVITSGGGYPLDMNYYQSVKGMCMALPALHKKSVLLQASECRNGVGSKAFYNLLNRYESNWRKFLADIEANKNFTELDQWEFQMLCRVLDLTGTKNLHFLSEGIPFNEQNQLYCNPVKISENIPETINAFIHRFASGNKDAGIAIIPCGPYTILRN